MLLLRRFIAGRELARIPTTTQRSSIDTKSAVGNCRMNGISVKRLNCSVSVDATAIPMQSPRKKAESRIDSDSIM